MDSIVNLIGLAVVVFASTNIDDVFVLIGFFADKNLGESLFSPKYSVSSAEELYMTVAGV